MTKMKKTALALGAACAFAFTGGITALNTLTAGAATDTEISISGFYGSKLTDPVAKAFYNGFAELAKESDGGLNGFRRGNTYELTSIDDAAKDYVENKDKTGTASLTKQFGAALDCFRYDYADLFYVNFDLLNFNVVESTSEGESPATTYPVTIGAGRATSYLLFDKTALNEASGEEGSTESIYAKYEAAYDELITAVANAIQPGAESLESLDSHTAKEKATAVNKVLGEKFTYSLDSEYGSTTYCIVPDADEKCYANSEGLARVYKMVMEKLGVNCILVSGYYVKDGTTKACTWNYVADGENWYAVDVANNMTSENEYLYVGEKFFLDHYEDRVVSLSNYELEYPGLAADTYEAKTVALQVAKGTFVSSDETVNKEGIAVKYTGEGTLELRTKEGGATDFGEWTTFADYMTNNNGHDYDTTSPEGGDTPAEFTYKIVKKDGIYYLFDLAEDALEVRVMNGETCVETVTDVAEAFTVAIPVLPANDARTSLQSLAVGASKEISITFDEALQKVDGADISVDFTVSDLSGTEVPVDTVKEYTKLENLDWDSANKKLTFKFTPSNQPEHNGLRYTFKINNLVTETGAVPETYPVVFRIVGIKANGVFVGSNLYTDIVTQPSLVFNNDLSLSGWTYGDGKRANDAMISSLALSVAKPDASVNQVISEAIKAAVAANPVFQASDSVVNATDNYFLNLTLDGNAVSIPANSYLKLAFPYPAGHGPKSDDSVIYKAVQFKKDAQGNLDYANPEILDVVAARQGLVVAVNDISAFAIVAIDKENVTDTSSKLILTETTGVGGTVASNTNKPVNKVGADSSIVYTVTAEKGYDLDYIMINGVALETLPTKTENTDETITYTYSLSGDNEALGNITYNVVRFEFKPASSTADYSASKKAASAFTKIQLERGEYSTVENDSIIRDYPVGGNAFTPDVPPTIIPPVPSIDTSSTSTQLIIVLSVVGGIALIGAIAIIYCGAIRPKILREREEEAERIAAQRERRANRNRPSGSTYDPRGRR